MTSGIYKLTFGNKLIYIGKSNDIERRWREHWDKFAKGTAAKNMQRAFSMYGYPAREVLYECHEDHCDIVEPYFIAINRGENMLNGAFPPIKEQWEYDHIFNGTEVLKYSTAVHVKLIMDKHFEIEKLKEEIDRTNLECDEELESIKSGTRIPELEDQILNLEAAVIHEKSNYVEQLIENKRLKNRGFFDRLFNN